MRSREKMYKQRLKNWGCRKNISLKSEDTETLRDLMTSKTSTPSRDVQLSSGQVITVDRLTTHLRRKQSPYYGRRNNQQDPAKRAPLSLRGVRDPDVFYVSENVLYQARTYIISRFAEHTSPNSSPEVVMDNWNNYSLWLNYCGSIEIALSNQRLDEALTLMRKGPESFTTILKTIASGSQLPNVIGMIFYFLSHVTRRRDFMTNQESKQLYNVVRALIKYASTVAEQEHLPPMMVQVLRSLWQVDGDVALYALSEKAWQMSCQSWDSIPAPDGKKADTRGWGNITGAGGLQELPPVKDQVLASAMSKLSPMKYSQLLVLHSSYLHSAIVAQGNNPFGDGRLVGIWKVVLDTVSDLALTVTTMTLLTSAYAQQCNWEQMHIYKQRQLELMQKTLLKGEFLRMWSISALTRHIKASLERELYASADALAIWRGELEALQKPDWEEEIELHVN